MNTSMRLPESEYLDINHFSRLFDNMSESYKIFWFQAIVELVLAGKDRMSYDELLNRMIVSAWYMVSEYHLNMGPSDTLEGLVNYIYKTSGLKSNEKPEKILAYLGQLEDGEFKNKKNVISYNVPYRLQAPFMPSMKGRAWALPKPKLAARINQEKRLIYYFLTIQGMQSEIRVQPEWINYITKNQEIIKGWIQFNLILYLQKRNPSVPGIASKLYPPQERKIERVKKYWKAIAAVSPLHDIYGDTELTQHNLSIDHFVPWSYVAHDELWNLHPTTRSINSSKSNNLPEWNAYFPKLCKIEYLGYCLSWQYEQVHKEFEKCLKEHVNNLDIQVKLYSKDLSKELFANRLEEVIYPVYHAAQEMGFGSWNLQQAQNGI
ncbi:HNH endonuclease domain-containing protein [Murimonas intestini]|uniref:HNH endonuclease n=1 Tax=Murimonas intestini TaxID=1337051 RepID=A0AB73T3D8_9FIRM|nr:HNH endonuclease domain-containing protein [Murimonas intestini]MCR1841508.1 HNH endonuclease [Murimonas intestini]MCR1867014.1 HNH endonuclease [Murimonas intestini]MCR1884037.1 HNH endonuclease [Murimonas intestini]